ncbi:MAG: BlaI/MecI/CopY family transcriptional regulator, partial [Planctomycetota bacterium]
MARPKQENLTQRELELMQVFWHDDPMTADAARERLQKNGRDLSYTTVANLCRGLREKGYLRCENDTR